MRTWSEQLADMLAELEDIESESDGEGWRAVSQKIQEARGPLSSAMLAAEQYESGELEPVGGF